MVEFKPEKYGKYLLLDRIARGGMAELFRGKIIGAQGFEKIVAIKKILPHLVDQDEFVKAFIDEARLAAFLQHPNIVQIYDFGEMAETFFISMEYLSGVDLKTVLKKSKDESKPLKLALSLFYILPQICYGLQYAHNLKDFSGEPLKIIHRDLGPQNIFITYNGEIKLIDFGIAKASSHDATTYVGSLKGKLAYMSPEQASGKEIDFRSDLFALGILLYELATGQRLYTGESQTILLKAGKAEFTPPEQVKQGLPASLYALINKALHVDPALRYQSAEQMRLDLEVCSQELAVRVSRGQMAAYMHELFHEEAAKEEKALKTAGLAVTPPPTPTPLPGQSDDISEEDKTIVLNAPPKRWNPKKIFVTFAALAFVVVVGIFFVDTSFTRPVQERLGSWFATGKAQLSDTVSSVKGKLENSSLQDRLQDSNKDSGFEEASYEAAILFFEKIRKNAKAGKIKIVENEQLHEHASYLEKNHPKEAFTHLSDMAKSHPKVASVHFYLGKIYSARYESRKATSAYLRALELNPKLTDAYFNLGYLYASAGKYTKAEKMYTQVVALKPPYLDEALVNLAVTQHKQGKVVESIHSLQKALKVNPRNKLAAKKNAQWQQ
ncbi:MAG: protein kinase [Thermodesulfobacteriota bacterium]